MSHHTLAIESAAIRLFADMWVNERRIAALLGHSTGSLQGQIEPAWADLSQGTRARFIRAVAMEQMRADATLALQTLSVGAHDAHPVSPRVTSTRPSNDVAARLRQFCRIEMIRWKRQAWKRKYGARAVQLPKEVVVADDDNSEAAL
ncbi:hypothetical protein BJ508DRAFT_325597 [Ascobolus immersus RN42]|uniref:Uncharacterized protein n=1 Tax=Ascobolus immersus RN42 TaxID=1160509 RepID=A0A3N4IA38_ASCIM|nr:hypothetical protein BJ508DRAFT_325597 [Ascobolus immersus RN42]